MIERPLTLADAPRVAAMAKADEGALRGKPSHVGPREVEAWWSRSDLAHDSWLFLEDGAAVAAGWFDLEGELGSVVGVVAQTAKGRGLGTTIAERGEAAAYARGARKLHTYVLAEDAAAAGLFQARGYRDVRRFYEMAIDLTAEPSVPALDPPLRLDGFRREDAPAFHAAMVESFRDHWEWHAPSFERWWELRGGNDQSLWFLVRDGDEVAAVARNEVRDAGGYVGLLGVRRPWRGRGLGKALLYRTFAEFWRRGLPRVSLGVDAESPTGATKLYELVGMYVENETVVYEKALE